MEWCLPNRVDYVVCATLALQIGCSEASLVQRLREWCYDAKNKRGAKRQTLDVSTCFAPLLAWMREQVARRRATLGLGSGCKHAQETLHGALHQCRLSWLCDSSGMEHRRSGRKGSWRPKWEALLSHVQDGVPANWTVLVLSDRGLYAPWLFEHIVRGGWHPFMRINKQGNVRPLDEQEFRSLASIAPTPGSSWCGKVECESREEKLITM